MDKETQREEDWKIDSLCTREIVCDKMFFIAGWDARDARGHDMTEPDQGNTTPGYLCGITCEHWQTDVSCEPCRACRAGTVFPNFTPKKPALPPGAIRAGDLQNGDWWVYNIEDVLVPSLIRLQCGEPEFNFPDAPVYLVDAAFSLKGEAQGK